MELKLFISGTFLAMGALALCHVLLNAGRDGSIGTSASIRILRASITKKERPLQVPAAIHHKEIFVSAFAPNAAEISLRGEPHQSIQIVLPQSHSGLSVQVGHSSLRMTQLHTFPALMGGLNSQGMMKLKLGAHLAAVENRQEDESKVQKQIAVVVSY